MEGIREEDREKFEELCKNPEFKHIVDGKLLKKVITNGDESEKCPPSAAKVKVHYHGTLLDGTVFDSSVRRNEPFEFNVGQGSVIKGWDQGVPTMNVNEKALFVIHPDMGYGESGSGAIPAKAVLQFEVTLLDYIEDDHEYPTAPEERLQCARAREEVARAYFQEEKFSRANAKYEKGTELLESIETDDKDLEIECFKLRATLFANMCLCYQKMGEFKRSLETGQEALDILKDNKLEEDELKVKIYCRMIKSNLGMRNPQGAVTIGQEGVESVKDPSIIQKELVRAQEAVAEEEKKKKELYQRMMKPSFHPADAGADGKGNTADKESV